MPGLFSGVVIPEDLGDRDLPPCCEVAQRLDPNATPLKGSCASCQDPKRHRVEASLFLEIDALLDGLFSAGSADEEAHKIAELQRALHALGGVLAGGVGPVLQVVDRVALAQVFPVERRKHAGSVAQTWRGHTSAPRA